MKTTHSHSSRRRCQGHPVLLLCLSLCCFLSSCRAFQVPTLARKGSASPPADLTSKSPSTSLSSRVFEPSDDLSLSLELNATDLMSVVLGGRETELETTTGRLQTTSLISDNDDKMPYIVMAVLCWGVALLSALDRVAMSVALLPMSQELVFSETTKGQVSSLLSIGYGLGILPCGLLVAVASPRVLLATGLGLWSLATLATPYAASFVSSSQLLPLLAVRACVGAAESCVLPATQGLVARWVPADSKSLALAGLFSGFQTGTICAYLLSPYVMEQFGGWRGLFFLYGSLGLVWLVPWWLFSRDAPTKPLVGLTPSSEVKIESVQENKSTGVQEAMAVVQSAPWREIFTSPAVWGMTLAHAANNWGLYTLLSWSPTFYSEQYGLGVHDSALFSILPSVAGGVGGLVAGYSADQWIKSAASGEDNEDDATRLTRVRKIYQATALLGPAACLACLAWGLESGAWNLSDQAWEAQALLTAGVGLQSFNSAGYAAANQEKAGEKWSGLLYSLTSLPGVMVGSFAVALTGQILDATQQDWSSVFGLNACVDVLGAVSFVWLYNSKREFD